MAKVTSLEKAQFKKQLIEFLSTNNYALVKDLNVAIGEKVAELVAQGVDAKEIVLSIWIIPKKNKPADTSKQNYHVLTRKTFTLDFNLLNNLIVTAINPVYDQPDVFQILVEQLNTQKQFSIFYDLTYPKIDPQDPTETPTQTTSEPDVCKIVIPENQQSQ